MICILGDSFAPEVFRKAARYHGIAQTDDPAKAEVVFVSQDVETDAGGERNLAPILELVRSVQTAGAVVLTSQVPVGFTRSLNRVIYHQSETLRVRDAFERAIYPEQFIVGCEGDLPLAYREYLETFKCPILTMTYEEAEFAKIAINMTLISQVENTNRLADYVERKGLDWNVIKRVLKNDRRIGPYSYLTPGRWQDSKHLMRDWVTFNAESF